MTADVGRGRILIVKLADLGDLLLSEPAIRSLREGFPAAEIDVLVTPGSAPLVPLLQLNVGVLTFPKALFDDPAGVLYPRRIAAAGDLALRLYRRRYHMLVLLHHLTTRSGTLKFRSLAAASSAPTIVGLDNGRGSFLTRAVTDFGFGVRHETEYMLSVAKQAGGAEVDPRPRLVAPRVEPPIALPERFAVVAPLAGGYTAARNWPINRFAELSARLGEELGRVVVVGTEDASAAAKAIANLAPKSIDLTGQTSLSALAAIVARATVVVGNDSFVTHLGAALSRPVVTIFGPSNVDAWRPFDGTGPGADTSDRRTMVVSAGLPCAPCLYTGFRLGRRHGCPTRTCLELVSVEQVQAAVRHVTEGSAS